MSHLVMSHRSQARATRGSHRTLLLVAVLLGAAVIASGWLVFRGMQAARALQAAQGVVVVVKDDLAAGSTQALVDRLGDLQVEAANARHASSDPVWGLAEHLPVVGDDLVAVRTVSTALDDLAQDALPAITELGTLLTTEEMRGADGRMDLGPVIEAAPTLARADATTRAARDAVAELDPATLVEQLAGPVVELQDSLERASQTLDAANQVATLLPSMLGADGPRTYLLLSLNSAELRSAGGIVGAVAVLRAEDGALDLVDQRTTPDIPSTEVSVLPLSAEEALVHTENLGRWIQDVVFTPDFPRSAALAQAIWEQTTGQVVDGVIATDPVAAAYLLNATGPVWAPDGTELRADNLLTILLHDAYLLMEDPAVADGFYTGVASTVFGAVGGGQGSLRAVAEQLALSVEEMRVRVWSAHPDEQAVLGATTVGGGFLSGADDAAAGVFLNDGAAAKLDYFLTTGVSIESSSCTPGGATVVRLDLAYDPPPDIVEYPMYVTGYSGTDLPTGWVQTNITAYSPVGGSITAQQVDDAFVGGLDATEAGRDVSVLTSTLSPGQRVSYRFTVEGPSGSTAVWTTPTITSPGLVRSACVLAE